MESYRAANCQTFSLQDKLAQLGALRALGQWIPTGVPQRVVRGPAKFGSTVFLLMFYYIRCHKIVIFNQSGVPPNFFKDLKGAADQKRLKNTVLFCKLKLFYMKLKVPWIKKDIETLNYIKRHYLYCEKFNFKELSYFANVKNIWLVSKVIKQDVCWGNLCSR